MHMGRKGETAFYSNDAIGAVATEVSCLQEVRKKAFRSRRCRRRQGQFCVDIETSNINSGNNKEARVQNKRYKKCI